MSEPDKGLKAFITKGNPKDLKQAYIPDLNIDLVVPNPYQPRIEIKEQSLIPLAESIQEHGIIEPLIVTKKSDTEYELIAGERRWRASKLARLKSIPVVVKEASPRQMLELAIIENIHRKDLNPLEEALAFEQLINLFNMTHMEIAKKIGFSRAAVANKLRLLLLPDEIKKMLLEEKLTEGHVRAILGLASEEVMIATSKIAVRDQLSVRAVEELVRRLNQGKKKERHTNQYIIDEFTQTLETHIQKRFGTDAKLFRTNRGGKIVIPFKNDIELEHIYKNLI